jgi:hypothetical protein
MDEKVFGYLLKQLQERVASVQGAIVAGRAEDFAAYKGLCGEVRGLRLAQEIVEDLAKRMNQNDDA